MSTRSHLYDRYVSGGHGCDPSDFAKRAPYLRYIIRRHFPPDRNVAILDLGCGSGALLYFAASDGYTNLCGVDLSEEQVAVARRLSIEARLEVGDGKAVLERAPVASIDVIVAFDVLEHVEPEGVVSFLRLAKSRLRRGGRLILHVPNGESPFFGSVRYGDFTHFLAFTKSSVRQVLGAAGFSSIDCYEEKIVAHGVKSLIRRALWPLVRACLRAVTAIETGDVGREAILTRNMLIVATD